jgi:homoserine O-acetyltransferase
MRRLLPLLLLLGGLATQANAQSLDAVESRHVIIKSFHLDSGKVLPELRIEYETYGKLSPDGRNAILMTHGYTSSHHAAGTYAPGKAPAGVSQTARGGWDKMTGPGRPIDTDRFFVVSSNMLGSSYGTTAPASIDPTTGKPYGPDFPRFTLTDIVRAQKELLDQLQVKHLVAVIGGSYGGYQAFTWITTYPEMMDGAVITVSSPKSTATQAGVDDLIATLARDPHWNNGWYYDNGGIGPAMLSLRVATLKRYGIEASLMTRFPDPVARDAEIARIAAPWAKAFDGNSLVVLRRATVGFDTEPAFPKIRAKILYALSRTDKLFPPSIAPAVMDKLKAAHVDAKFIEIDSDNGHTGYSVDADKWMPDLKAFMDRIAPPTTH